MRVYMFFAYIVTIQACFLRGFEPFESDIIPQEIQFYSETKGFNSFDDHIYYYGYDEIFNDDADLQSRISTLICRFIEQTTISKVNY